MFALFGHLDDDRVTDLDFGATSASESAFRDNGWVEVLSPSPVTKTCDVLDHGTAGTGEDTPYVDILA